MPKLKSGESAVAALDAKAALKRSQERLRAQTKKTAPAPATRRSTDRMSISLLGEERIALEERAARLRFQGYRDIKPSRLARIAFHMLLVASDEEILKWAEEVENLEVRRVKRK